MCYPHSVVTDVTHVQENPSSSFKWIQSALGAIDAPKSGQS
ncbi:unnamed protein product [Amoebophrya sp. A25]|nr:unnamed protein product [Amoebophrya sp. A25]|eukprot:GSA25T00016275001.1